MKSVARSLLEQLGFPPSVEGNEGIGTSPLFLGKTFQSFEINSANCRRPLYNFLYKPYFRTIPKEMEFWLGDKNKANNQEEFLYSQLIC